MRFNGVSCHLLRELETTIGWCSVLFVFFEGCYTTTTPGDREYKKPLQKQIRRQTISMSLNWEPEKTTCWVVVSNIFYFQPYLGKIPILTNIFQRGWNHQLENVFRDLQGLGFPFLGFSFNITSFLQTGNIFASVMRIIFQGASLYIGMTGLLPLK